LEADSSSLQSEAHYFGYPVARASGTQPLHQPDLDRSVKTFRACLLHSLPRTSIFFVQKRPMTPRAGVFARAGNNILLKKVRTAVRWRRPGRVHGRMWRRDARAAVRFEYSMKKPAADFSARAFDDFCDDAAMPVICPTCQIV
jgi:hypothetical protein